MELQRYKDIVLRLVPISYLYRVIAVAGTIILILAIKLCQTENQVAAAYVSVQDPGEPTKAQEQLLDDDPQPVSEASLVPDFLKPTTSAWVREDGKPNFFRIVMIETKRREAMGRPGRELERYKDGKEWAIGYGCHIRYLNEHWTRVVKNQNYRVTETQARAIMYQVFHLLDKEVARDFPNATEAQRWAVKSLAFNWGYGNVKSSKLWRLISKGKTGKQVADAWMKCHAGTANHRRTRVMEYSLWNGDYKTATDIAKDAFKEISRRGDFKHY